MVSFLYMCQSVVARVNQNWGGVATIFWLKSRNLRFFSGGVKKFPDFVEQKKFFED